MVRRTDEGWLIFERELEKRKHLSNASIAQAVGGLAAEDVKNWRSGRARPRFSMLPEISAALGKHPTYLAEKMGMVPSLDEAARRLAEEQQKNLDRAEIALRTDDPGETRLAEGLRGLVDAVARSREWAIAIWPAFEGPEGAKLYVGDRVDFRRTVGDPNAPIKPDDVREAFGEALKYAGLRLGRTRPRWTEDRDDPTISRWFSSNAARQFTPAPIRTGHGLASLVVTGQDVETTARLTAAMVARLIGYGHQSAMDVDRFRRGALAYNQAARLARETVHVEWLKEVRRDYVWSAHLMTTTPEALFGPEPKEGRLFVHIDQDGFDEEFAATPLAIETRHALRAAAEARDDILVLTRPQFDQTQKGFGDLLVEHAYAATGRVMQWLCDQDVPNHLNQHGLRRAHASMLAQGGDLKTIADQVGLYVPTYGDRA